MNLEEKKQEIRSKLDKKVLPEITQLIEQRDKVKEKLERLEKALPEHESKLEKLNLEVNDLIDAVAEALGEGKDPKKKQTEVREIQNQISETKAMVLTLTEKFIPEAKTSLKSAEEALKSAVRAAVGSIRDEYEKRMAKLIDDGIEYWQAWDDATKGFYGEHRILLLAGTAGEVPRFHKKSERLNLYINNVIGAG